MEAPIKISSSADERERLHECPICLNPLTDSVVYLATNPDEPYKRFSVCTHAFCESCIADVLATAEREKRVPECSYCRRKILGVIRSELATSLFREVASMRANANKQGEGYRGIIAELNSQKKKLKEELQVAQDELQRRDAANQQHAARYRELETRTEAAVREAHAKSLQSEADAAAANRERDLARAEAAQLRQQVAEKAAHADDLGKQAARVEALEAELLSARRDLDRARAAADAQQKADAAKRAADSAKAEEALQAERAAARQLRDDLARVTAAARAAEAEAEAQRSELAKTIEANREATARQQTELAGIQRQLAVATAESEQLRAAAAAAAQEAQRAGDWEPQRDAYERQLGAARQALIDKENECFSLDQHRVALQQQLAEHAHQLRKLEAQLDQIRKANEKGGKQAAAGASYYGLGTVLSVAGGWLSAAAGSGARGLFLRPADFTVLTEDPLPAAAALQQNALGAVYKAREVANNRLCLLTQVRVPARSERAQLATAREVVLLSRLAHQNLVRLDGLLRDPVLDGWQFGLVLSPLVPDTLEHTLRTFHFEPRDVRSLFQQILSLLAYLHSAQIVLRTMHSAMFLFVKQSGTLKLMSLSTARSLHSEPFDALPPHTLPYWAPELLYVTTGAPARIDWKAADCWAAGSLFAEILAGRRLFEDCADSLMLLASVLGVRDFRPAVLDDRVITALPVLAQEQFKLAPVTLAELVPTASGPALELIAKLMCLYPADRVGPRAAAQHAFFAQTAFPAVSECKFERDLADVEVMRWADQNGLFK